MNRLSRSDPALDRLNEEREQAAIEVSLAWDAQPADLVKLAVLQRKLKQLEGRIHLHKLQEAAVPPNA